VKGEPYPKVTWNKGKWKKLETTKDKKIVAEFDEAKQMHQLILKSKYRRPLNLFRLYSFS